VENRAAWIRLNFSQGSSQWLVSCGDAAIYPLPGCSQAPTVYGVLASPDLNADKFVDGGDWALMATLLGKTITLVTGWQADFNHVGTSVNAGDLAYLAARLGQNCSSKKMGSVSYDADIHNLEVDYVEATLDRLSITKAQILAYWDEMGFSYDQSAVGTILSASDPGTERPSWTTVKKLYRD
jgi:hypothetical protein